MRMIGRRSTVAKEAPGVRVRKNAATGQFVVVARFALTNYSSCVAISLRIASPKPTLTVTFALKHAPRRRRRCLSATLR